MGKDRNMTMIFQQIKHWSSDFKLNKQQLVFDQIAGISFSQCLQNTRGDKEAMSTWSLVFNPTFSKNVYFVVFWKFVLLLLNNLQLTTSKQTIPTTSTKNVGSTIQHASHRLYWKYNLSPKSSFDSFLIKLLIFFDKTTLKLG